VICGQPAHFACLAGVLLSALCQSNLVSKKNKQCKRCIMAGSLLLRLLMVATKAWLLDLGCTDFPFHFLPQIAAATTMGINSFVAVLSVLEFSSHLS